MRFFNLDTLADGGSNGFCFVGTRPDGLGPSSYRLTQGEPLTEDYPSHAWDVIWKLDRSTPGLTRPSLIGNTCNMLAVHADVCEIIRTVRTNLVEFFPFSLVNHRGRDHSKDYLFVNPLGTFDCLNLERSVINRRRNGTVSSIASVVLDKRKLADPLDLFRIREDPTTYVISERLADAFAKKGFTNIVLTELEVA